MTQVIIGGQTLELPESEVTALQEKYGKPKYDRMQVLRGEWRPGANEKYYTVPNDDGAWYWCAKPDITNKDHLAKGYKFFPTRELAEEYLLIEKGEWLPKKGDITYSIMPDGQLAEPFNGEYFAKHWKHFPSAQQRQAYIDKQKKPQLPTVSELLKAWEEFYRLIYNPLNSIALALNNFAKGRNEERGGELDPIVAKIKSPFLASRIRSAEKGMGDADFTDYCVAYDKNAQIFGVLPVSAVSKHICVEYFATQAGCELYKEAMGVDLEHLLCK